jgi:acyl-CoA synthetase (AMP-forming)/AMP-acid ligase II
MKELNNLVDILHYRAAKHPERQAYIQLNHATQPEKSITYGELHTAAWAVAQHLKENSVPGERALLFYDMGIDYLIGFFGCLYAQIIAVPIYLPTRSMHMQRLQSIVEDSTATLGLSNSIGLKKIFSFINDFPKFKKLNWIATDKLVSQHYADNISLEIPNINKDFIALLQYTSGSTSAPKGVMISHANLIYNQQMIQTALVHDESSTIATWVPLYHDLGLIAHALQSIYIGSTNVLISPMHFIQKPYRWLKAITDYKVATSGAPNFAYKLCINKITAEQVQTLDLSSWTAALNAAEPISLDTLKVFNQKFKVCGFKKNAFFPAYGLAEATVFVAGNARSALIKHMSLDVGQLRNNSVVQSNYDGDVIELVNCGHSWLDQEVCIVNPKTFCLCGERQIGEIWVKGNNIARGYWQKTVETKSTFKAYLKDSGKGPFLRTGDLGFMDNGCVYFCSRIKDIIIIRGVNYYPHDIEQTVGQSHSGIVSGASVAFSIMQDEEEALIIVAEISKRYRFYEPYQLNDVFNEIKNSIRRNITDAYDLSAKDIVLVKQFSIPKTTSGKIQRSKCKKDYLSNDLDVIKSIHDTRIAV